MSDGEEGQTSSGSWQPDPTGRYKQRWQRTSGEWTNHVCSSEGELGNDPYYLTPLSPPPDAVDSSTDGKKVKPPIYRRWWAFVLYGFIILGVMANLVETDENEEATDDTSAESESSGSEIDVATTTVAPTTVAPITTAATTTVAPTTVAPTTTAATTTVAPTTVAPTTTAAPVTTRPPNPCRDGTEQAPAPAELDCEFDVGDYVVDMDPFQEAEEIFGTDDERAFLLPIKIRYEGEAEEGYPTVDLDLNVVASGLIYEPRFASCVDDNWYQLKFARGGSSVALACIVVPVELTDQMVVVKIEERFDFTPQPAWFAIRIP